MSNILTNNINPRSGNTITIGGVNDIVSIAGSISYDDVTNVDAIGIVTARGGLNVGPLTGIAFTVSSAGAVTSAGTITVSDIDITSNTTTGCEVRGDGLVRAQRASGSASAVIQGWRGNLNTSSINANGNAFFLGAVGVGTITNPSTYSAAANNLLIWGSGDSGLTIRSGSGDEGGIYFNDTDDGNQRGIIRYIHGGDGTDHMAFHTSGGEAMRIDANRKVAIGGSPNDGWQSSSNTNVLQIKNGVIAEYSGLQLDVGNNFYYDGTDYRYIQDGDAQRLVLFDRQFIFNLVNDGTADAAITWSESMRVDASGKLLLGKSSSVTSGSAADSLVQIVGKSGSLTDLGQLTIARGNTSSNLGNNAEVGEIIFSDNAGAKFAQIQCCVDGTAGGVNGNPGRLVFYTEAQGSDGGPVARMRINKDGNFSLGRDGQITLNDGNVSSSVFEQLANNEYPLALHADETNKRGLAIYYADTGVGAEGDPYIICQNQSSTKFEVRSNGTTRIGDPTSSGNGGLALFNSDAGTASQRGRQVMYAKSGTAGTQEIFQIFNGSTEQLRIATNGNITNVNNSYGQLSDISLKENIVDASSQWSDIKNVKLRNFNFKQGETHKQLGVVAQELETVSPGLVYENTDNLKCVNTSVLYMKALGALQEAMTKIETLEQRLTDAGL